MKPPPDVHRPSAAAEYWTAKGYVLVREYDEHGLSKGGKWVKPKRDERESDQ
jgi:hypothetical protein